jgi:hypothetical protein
MDAVLPADTEAFCTPGAGYLGSGGGRGKKIEIEVGRQKSEDR